MTAMASHTPGREERWARSEAVEDYAKAIFSLEQRAGTAVATTALATRLGVSPGAVSGMLKRLSELDLVAHERYHGVRLTPRGRRVALEVIRHHRLLEAYLAEVLGMSWDRVHAEAEILEHYISDELEELIAGKLGDPDRDPHGDPIPDRELALPAEDVRALAELEPGDAGIVARVSDSDPSMLRYLSERGIRPGTELRVEDKQPFGGPMFVRIGDEAHALGGALGAAIWLSGGSR